MKNIQSRVTGHAAQRMTQRNLEIWDIELVMGLGKELYRSGVTFYFLGKRQVPIGEERALEPLVGTTVVVGDGRVKTVYRNRRALRKIRRKSKRSRSSDARRQLWNLITPSS